MERPHRDADVITNRCMRRATADRLDSERRGVVILEFILVFPIILIATLAVFQAGFLLLFHQAVTTAAIEGARTAAKFGVPPNQSNVEPAAEQVQAILAVHGVTFDTTGTTGGGEAFVRVEYGPIAPPVQDPGVAAQFFEFGNATIVCPPPSTPGTNLVRVSVCTPLTDATGSSPIPDLLGTFGLSLQGRRFETTALAQLE